MDDRDLLERIGALVDEEHRLEASRHDDADPAVVSRIGEIEVMLDQCWDLLRRRRARRADEGDGAAAAEKPRDADTVERYLQ